MILTEAQSRIARDTHRFRVVNCGRRFGKTTLAVWEMIAKAMSADDMNIAYFANTYQQARDIAWKMLKKLAFNAIVDVNESRLEVRVRTGSGGTSLITLRGWENVDTARGIGYDFLVIDEVASMKHFRMNWEEVLLPTLTQSKGDVLFISTPKGFNHFYDLYNEEREDETFKSFHFTSYDNPLLPVEELDRVKERMTEDRFAQEYLADFRKTEGLVYKEFNRDLHVVDNSPSSELKCIAGLDFGYTNPYGFLKIVIDSDNTFWVIDERYEMQKTTQEIIQTLKTIGGFNELYPDPAEPDRIEEFTRAGFNCMEVSKDVVAGIDKVRELFKQNKIKIHRSCENLISELETYKYPEKKLNQNEKEKPIKEDDHLMDALRYALYNVYLPTYIKPLKKKYQPMTKYGG